MAEEGYRREADLGARWAPRGSPSATKVTVTDVVVTEVDTSVGDVYEARAATGTCARSPVRRAGPTSRPS